MSTRASIPGGRPAGTATHRNQRMRQLHRWVSVIFTVFVLANFVVMPLGNEQLGMAVGGLTLLPLLVLMMTGLWLFALPYRSPARASGAGLGAGG